MIPLHFFKTAADIYPRISCVHDGHGRLEPIPTLSRTARTAVRIAVMLVCIAWIYLCELFGSPIAYVRGGFGIYTRLEYALFISFPLILLTALPIAAALVFPIAEKYLLLLAALNFGCAVFDICMLPALARLSKGSAVFLPFGVLVSGDERMCFRTIAKKSGSDALIYRQFELDSGRLTEVPFVHNEASRRLEREFAEQFGLENFS